jgi:predicted MPP superfamily phosphohydrolase
VSSSNKSRDPVAVLYEADLMSRRAFVNGGLFGGLAAIGLTGFEIFQARYIHPYRPRLEQVDLPLPDGAEGLDGMRIAFITDTHVGPFISTDDLQRALDLIPEHKPDLVLFGGDYVSESPRYAPGTAMLLGQALNGIPLGGVGVLGNHDLSVSRTAVQEAMVTVGIPILRYAVTVVTYKGTDLAIAGIDETLLGDPQPVDTLAQVRAGTPALALWHEPEFADQAARAGAAWQLSGHTHGGQIRIPGIGPVGLPVHGKKYVIGRNNASGMPIYTSRGVGVYRPPARFDCPPEVSLITLRARNE